MWGFVGRDGSVLVSPRYEDARRFCGGLAVVKCGGLFGYADESGRVVVEPNFVQAEPFSEGRARVRTGMRSKWSFIEVNGEFAFKGSFVQPLDFREGFAPVLY